MCLHYVLLFVPNYYSIIFSYSQLILTFFLSIVACICMHTTDKYSRLQKIKKQKIIKLKVKQNKKKEELKKITKTVLNI